MARPTETEYGTDVSTYDRVTDDNSYMQEYINTGVRVNTNSLSRIYYPIYLANPTTATGTYYVGICPFASYLVDVKHIVQTVSSAATVEVESSSSGACMTADAAANTLQTATLATDSADRLFDQGDTIIVKIATGGGDLVDLCIMLTLEPIR